MVNLITSPLHQTRKEEKFLHKPLSLAATPDLRSSKRLSRLLQCESEKQIRRCCTWFVTEAPRCCRRYLRWDMRENREGWTRIGVSIRLWSAFRFDEASSNRARPSRLSLIICRWKGTRVHCLSLANKWASCHLEFHLHQSSRVVYLFECSPRDEFHQLLLKWYHPALKQKPQFQCLGKHQVQISL